MENFRPVFIKVSKNKILFVKFWQISFQDVWFIELRIRKHIGSNKTLGRWSYMVSVMLPDIASRESKFEKILSMRVLECLVSLVYCKISWIIECEARESRNLFVGWCLLQFSKLMLKSPRRKICFCSFEILSSSWLIKKLKSNTSILWCLWTPPSKMLLFLELIISIKVGFNRFSIHITVNSWFIRQSIGNIKHCSNCCWFCRSWFKRIVI